MKLYEVVFNEEEDKGVYAVSLVESPAMEDTWLALKEHPKEIQFSAVDDEKKLLLGAVLIPNKKVYRNMDGNEFYITFNENTIERTAHNFFKNGYQNNSSENHEVKLEGVSFVESWIVQDPDTDKSKAFGKTYEKGTWVAMAKVDNEEAYKKAKEGKLNGFSIDGLFSLKEIMLKQDDMSDKAKSFIEELKEAIGLNKTEVKMGQLKLKDGKTKITFEGEKPEVEMPVFLVLEDGEKERVPEGKHELEDGSFLYVDANGLVSAEPKEEEQPKIEEEVKDAVMEMASQFKQEIASFKAQMAEMKADFEAQLKAEKEKNEALEAKLAKEPAEDKIVPVELKNFEPKTQQERFWLSIQQAKN